MKKIFYLLAIAAIAFTSCKQEEPEVVKDKPETDAFTFKASIEGLSSGENGASGSNKSDMAKATINGDYQLVWAENDQIGIYFPAWSDKNQPFRLNAEDAGKTQGEFTIATAANPSGASATAAYFPWEPEGKTTYPGDWQNNVYNGVMYFKLRDNYYGYSSNKMLTPLIASISSSSDNISFKHAGAAVKLTINNLTSGTYKVKMSVTDEQITGNFHVNPANAGSDVLTLDATKDASKNNVTLNTYKEGSGAFSWIFPVPTLTKPKLQFEIKDKNGIVVWSKNLKAQTSDLGRADLLVMSAIDITAYDKFKESDTWCFYGKINGSTSYHELPIMSDGNYCILSGFTFKDGDEFKIKKKDGSWEYPSGKDDYWNFNSTNAGTKDIIYDISAENAVAVDPGCPYPTVEIPASISLTDNSFADWDLISGSTNGYTTVKAAADATYLYVYFKRTNGGRYSEIWKTSGNNGAYVYVALDVDENSANGEKAGDGSGPYDFYGYFYPFGAYVSDPESYTVALQSTGSSGPSPYTLTNLTLRGSADASAVEVELKIPRSDLPTISSSKTTTIYVWGNKDMSMASISRKL